MKTFTRILGLRKSFGMITMCTVCCTLIMSCELDDVNFNAELKAYLLVDENTEGQNMAYAASAVLDATQDTDIQKYQKKIKQITVNSIACLIESYDGPDICTFTGTISFGKKDSSTKSAAITLENFDLYALAESGNAETLPADQTTREAIADLLMQDYALNVYVDGVISETPVAFNTRIIIDTDVKADAIE